MVAFIIHSISGRIIWPFTPTSHPTRTQSATIQVPIGITTTEMFQYSPHAANDAYRIKDLRLGDFVGHNHSDEWVTSIYQLLGKRTLANAEGRRPPATFTGTQQSPPIPAQWPRDRHFPDKAPWRRKGRPGERNTMIDPGVVSDADIRADIEAINRGEGYIHAGNQRIWINGRFWGIHLDTGTGRLYPLEGHGFVPMNQLQYYAFRKYVEYNGINDHSEDELSHLRDLTEEDREIARRVWRMREESED